MRLKWLTMFPLLLVLLAGTFWSACSSTTAHNTAPEPTPDLQPTVDALVGERLEEMQQEAAARAEAQRRIAEILTPAPTPLTAPTVTPLPAPTLIPVSAMSPGNGRFVDPQGRFRFSWWPEEWSEDTEFGKELLGESSPLFAPNVIFFGGNPIPGGYNPNVMVMRLVVPAATQLPLLVDQELNNLKLAYPGIRIVDRRTTYLDGIPAELVASVHDYDALQFFYLILLKDNREWFVQCTLSIGMVSEAEACRDVLNGFSFTDTPTLP